MSSRPIQRTVKSVELPGCVTLPHKRNAAVHVRLTQILLNYRRLRGEGQRLRCATRNPASSNRNTGGAPQHPPDPHLQRPRQGVTFGLRYGRVFAKQPPGKPPPPPPHPRARLLRAP